MNSLASQSYRLTLADPTSQTWELGIGNRRSHSADESQAKPCLTVWT